MPSANIRRPSACRRRGVIAREPGTSTLRTLQTLAKADAPEITSAVTALAGHQSKIGAGVVIGSNVFNLAALLGLSVVLAGKIGLHRRVIVMEGTVALWIDRKSTRLNSSHLGISY